MRVKNHSLSHQFVGTLKLEQGYFHIFPPSIFDTLGSCMFFSFFTARFSPFHRKLMLTGSADGADGWSSCISSLKSESGFQNVYEPGLSGKWTWRKGTVNVGNFSCKYQGWRTDLPFARLCEAFRRSAAAGHTNIFSTFQAQPQVFMCHTEQFFWSCGVFPRGSLCQDLRFSVKNSVYNLSLLFVTRRGTFRHAQFPQLRGPPQGLPVLLHDLFFHEIFVFVTPGPASLRLRWRWEASSSCRLCCLNTTTLQCWRFLPHSLLNLFEHQVDSCTVRDSNIMGHPLNCASLLLEIE